MTEPKKQPTKEAPKRKRFTHEVIEEVIDTKRDNSKVSRVTHQTDSPNAAENNLQKGE